jgi:transposase-like protein
MNASELSRLTEDQAREMVERIRWPNGPVCHHCGSLDVVAIGGKSGRPGLKRCKDCRKQFTVTVGTIFESSHVSLRNWVYAFARMCASKTGISAYQLHRELGVTPKTAWFMCHRIRHAMRETGGMPMLTGTVEVDETYVGGKPMNKGGQNKRGRGTKKTPVLALVERKGQVRTQVIANVTGKTLKDAIREQVSRTAEMMTDENSAYHGIGREFEVGHRTVRHNSGQYATPDGTGINTAESYFAIMKRGAYGTFHHVSKGHLPRYCDEFTFRRDQRGVDDGQRTITALGMVEGNRLTYA